MKKNILYSLIYFSSLAFCPQADAQQVFIPMVDNPTLIGGNGLGAMFILLLLFRS